MRKILLLIAALIGVIATLGATSGSASADAHWVPGPGSSNYEGDAHWVPGPGSAPVTARASNCVTVPEKNRLHAGMSPGDVRRTTGAAPWMRVGDVYQGQRVSLEAFDSCRGPGQALAVMYRIDGNGGRHLMLARFIAL